jgi:Ca2+-binding RTX toxin-like protein
MGAAKAHRVGLIAVVAMAALVGTAVAAQVDSYESSDQTNVNYNAEPGEQNQITAKLVRGVLQLTDVGADVSVKDIGDRTDRESCTEVSAHRVSCDVGGNTFGLYINTSGGDDRVDLHALNNVEANDYGITNVNGGVGADRLIGTLANDNLYGGVGADFLDGGRGQDVLSGGAGNDRLVSKKDHSNQDTVSGDAGNDVIDTRDTAVRGGVKDIVDCGAGRDSATVDKKDVVKNCEHVTRR